MNGLSNWIPSLNWLRHYRREDLRYALTQSKTRALFLSEAFRNNAYLETVAGLRDALPDLETVVCIDGARPGAEGLDTLEAEGAAEITDSPAPLP